MICIYQSQICHQVVITLINLDALRDSYVVYNLRS